KKPEVSLAILMQKLDSDAAVSVTEWGQHPKLIQLYLRQFAREAPEFFDDNTIQSALCPIFALYGLARAYRLLCDSALLPDFKKTCEAHWPELWKWINPLYRYRLRMKSSPLPDTHVLYIEGGVHAILGMIIDSNGLLPCIAATEGLLGLLFAMYLRFAQFQPLTGFRLRLPMLSALLDSGEADLNEIHGEIGFNKRKAAQALFRPAYSCMRKDLKLEESYLPAQYILFKISTTLPAFYRSLSSEVFMTYICDGMSFLLAQPNRTSSLIYDNLLALLANYARHAIEGHAWLVHGLRKNLLGLLFHGTNFVDMDNSENTLNAMDFLLETIQANSIHRSIMRNLSDIDEVVDPNEIHHPKMRLSWDNLLTTVRWVLGMHMKLLAFGPLPECSYIKVSRQVVLLINFS
ncbi:hypothetical protein H0H93_009728, partial [Arthromyces matolae]